MICMGPPGNALSGKIYQGMCYLIQNSNTYSPTLIHDVLILIPLIGIGYIYIYI